MPLPPGSGASRRTARSIRGARPGPLGSSPSCSSQYRRATIALIVTALATSAAAAPGGAVSRLDAGKPKLKLTGFAFVTSAVTARGGGARLPRGTKIYRSGSTIRGTTGCPTTQYRTDGLLVAVIDYHGRPTAASVTVTRKPAGSGQSFTNAPYYLDLNSGRRIQYLGPIFDNGSYGVVVRWGFNSGRGSKVSGKLVLARTCPVLG